MNQVSRYLKSNLWVVSLLLVNLDYVVKPFLLSFTDSKKEVIEIKEVKEKDA